MRLQRPSDLVNQSAGEWRVGTTEGREPPAGHAGRLQDRIPGTPGPIIITEMVPESESAEEWTEMVSNQLFIGLKSVSPEAFRAESRKKWLEACKDGNFAEIASGEENGYPMALWMLSCPHSKAPGAGDHVVQGDPRTGCLLRRAEILPLRAVERTGAAVDALSAADQCL